MNKKILVLAVVLLASIITGCVEEKEQIPEPEVVVEEPIQIGEDNYHYKCDIDTIICIYNYSIPITFFNLSENDVIINNLSIDNGLMTIIPNNIQERAFKDELNYIVFVHKNTGRALYITRKFSVIDVIGHIPSVFEMCDENRNNCKPIFREVTLSEKDFNNLTNKSNVLKLDIPIIDEIGHDEWAKSNVDSYNNATLIDTMKINHKNWGSCNGVPGRALDFIIANNEKYEEYDIDIVIIPDSMENRILKTGTYTRNIYDNLVISSKVIGTEHMNEGIVFLHMNLYKKLSINSYCTDRTAIREFSFHCLPGALYEQHTNVLSEEEFKEVPMRRISNSELDTSSDIVYYNKTGNDRSCYSECENMITCLINCE